PPKARWPGFGRADVCSKTSEAMSSRPLLIEIGVEELPSSFVDNALLALPHLTRAKLEGLRLLHGAIHVYGTPRRLAVLVDGVAETTHDVDDEVLGPPEAASYKDGKPTKAAEAFATKLGVTLDSLVLAEKPAAGNKKAGKYLVGRRVEKGGPATELLSKAIT